MEPIRPEERIDQETAQTVRERLATFDEDVKTAKDAREVLADIRRSIAHHPAPR